MHINELNNFHVKNTVSWRKGNELKLVTTRLIILFFINKINNHINKIKI